MKYTKEQLNKIYETLPEDIQDAIYSVDSADAIEEIGKKYSLHIDQISSLGRETGYILLGVSDPMEFVSILSTKLKIDSNIASKIVSDINERIFLPIKDSLRRVHSNQKIKEKEQTVQATDTIKSIETTELNVPKETVDILKGKIPVPIKNKSTEILGFNAEKPDDDHMNVMEEKMKGSFNIPKSETGGVVDPYREPIN